LRRNPFIIDSLGNRAVQSSLLHLKCKPPLFSTLSLKQLAEQSCNSTSVRRNDVL